MLLVVWPGFWMLFIPIVLVEMILARRMMGMTTKRATLASLSSNAVSTLLGVPVTWAILAALELGLASSSPYELGKFWVKFFAVTAQAPWLPGEGEHWMVPVAAGVLLVPFFFMSVHVEWWVMRLWARGRSGESRRWSWRANGVSYAGMLALTAGWAVIALVRGK